MKKKYFIDVRFKEFTVTEITSTQLCGISRQNAFFLVIIEVPQENAFCINMYSNKKIPPESAMGKKIQSAILLVYKSKVKNNNDKIKYRQGVPMNGLSLFCQ